MPNWAFFNCGMTQNASAFCHPEGVFTPLPSAKNVKTDRQDPVHLCVGTADHFVVIPRTRGIQLIRSINLRNNAK